MNLNLNCIGREKIFTDEKEINKSNVIKVLKKAYAIHRRNAGDAQYLIDYEAGVQPLPYKKIVRSDIDIRTSYDTYSFQILNNDSIVMLFKYFKKNNLKINDPLDLISLYQNKDAVALNKYLDIHFKKWAKKYHLDNPRNTDSLFSRFKKDDEN